MGRSIIQEVTPKIIDEMVKIIVEAAHPEKVILFGSWARGDNRKDSDIDFIIVKSPSENHLKETSNIHRMLSKFMIPTDILIYSQGDIDYWSDSINHVIARALREGKVLYERH